MGAVIAVQVDSARTSNRENPEVIDTEAAALAFAQLFGTTKKMHGEGLPEVTVTA
ncbi:hypothetical protein D3C79_1115910 [compost metagenome]